jgi:hypothetical protein
MACNLLKYEYIALLLVFNTRNNSDRLNNIVIIELLAGYISPFWLMNHMMLLAYVYAKFKAERNLQTYFGSR